MVLVPSSPGQASSDRASPGQASSNQMGQTRAGQAMSIDWGEPLLIYSAEFLQIPTLDQGITVAFSVAAALSEPDEYYLPENHLLLLRIRDLNFLTPYLESDTLEPEMLPLAYACFVTDASILALLQLLQVELQTPQPLNPLFAHSILQVLTVHVLRRWQEPLA